MNMRTYHDPPTVLDLERKRLKLRRSLALALVFLIGLVFRSFRADKGS